MVVVVSCVLLLPVNDSVGVTTTPSELKRDAILLGRFDDEDDPIVDACSVVISPLLDSSCLVENNANMS